MIRSLTLWIVALASFAGMAGIHSHAATFQLSNGQSITGEPIAPDGQGLIFKLNATTFSERIGWTNFTESALQEMAKDPKLKPFVADYLIDESAFADEEKAAREIKPKTGPKLDRPDPKAGFGALFSSSLSVAMFAALYLANLYAAFEIAIFRNYHPGLVCGIAAVFPVLGPILFLSLPTHLRKLEEAEPEGWEGEEAADAEAVEGEAGGEHVHAAAEAPAAEAHQGPTPPTIYQRGQFTFNRRFFETKLAGFLRVVPSEAEQDMVVCVESSRGNYVGNRIARILPNELYLHVTKGGASSDVVIPFNEIKEVQIRHKDA
jgi:hypothetical protein